MRFKYYFYIVHLEVGHIKFKFFMVLIFIFIIGGLFSVILLESCKAYDQKGVYFVGDPTYRLTNSIIKNNKIIGQTYQINVTLHNNGNTRSEELNINLTDETGFLNKKTYLEAGETQVISFTWSTLKIKNHRITFYFHPSDLDTIWTKYNSGSKSITLKIEDSKELPATSTPGFELILVIIAICLGILRRR